LTGRQLGIFHAGASGLNEAPGCDYPFATDSSGLLMCFRLRVGIEDQLSDAFSVAKVDEDEVAVVAVGVGPAGYCYYFTCVVEPELAAIACSFQHSQSSKFIYLYYQLKTTYLKIVEKCFAVNNLAEIEPVKQSEYKKTHKNFL
jgi:hypothetical protein